MTDPVAGREEGFFYYGGMENFQKDEHAASRALVKKRIESWGGEYSPRKYRRKRLLILFFGGAMLCQQVVSWVTFMEYRTSGLMSIFIWCLVIGGSITASYSSEKITGLILYARSLEKELKTLRKETDKSISSSP